MPNELFTPRADLIDDQLWIETPQTTAAMAALWTVLDISRQEPRPWVPRFVLCGEQGTGKTALTARFLRAAQRNVACSLVAEATRDLDARSASDAASSASDRSGNRDRARAEWAEEMVATYGNCPNLCRPAAWVPESVIAQALSDAQEVDPAILLEMSAHPDKDGGFLGSWIWGTPGNLTHHSARRTSLAFVDQGDRLLNVPKSRRNACLEKIEGFTRVIGHPVTFVLIGSPALAQAVSECGTTHVIRLDPMPDDGVFAEVAAMIFGARDTTDVTSLNRASRGAFGPLLHLARMRGLKPPYFIPTEKIRTLPAPASDRV